MCDETPWDKAEPSEPAFGRIVPAAARDAVRLSYIRVRRLPGLLTKGPHPR